MRFLRLIALTALAAALLAPGAQADPAPAWALRLTPMPSNFAPGGTVEFLVASTNIGGAATSGPVELRLTLPSELTATAAEGRIGVNKYPCAIAGQQISCETNAPIAPSQRFWARVIIDVAESATGSATAVAGISGGGGTELSVATSPPYQTSPQPFGFLDPGLTAPLSESDGAASVLAGSHPYQQTVAFSFPTEAPPDDFLTNAGHPHTVVLDLPPGLVGSPAATPVLCTEVQLQRSECPTASQIGWFELTTIEGDAGIIGLNRDPIYNMAPPPGSPAELAVEVAGLGFFAHLFADVRSDGDYGIEVTTPDVLALGTTPFFEIQTEVWGDASDPAHGLSLAPQKDAFWTQPTRCDGQPATTAVRADSWEEPGAFAQANYQSVDIGGTPVSTTGCASLSFEPTLETSPTSNLADSPTGLDVRLHQPQQNELGHRAPAQLKDAIVTVPDGMVANPAQADGLKACDSSQIGLTSAIGITPVTFDKDPAQCPDGAKLGTVEVASPLLPQRDADTKLVLDPETGNPKPEPVSGTVYLAKPFDNPFGSLLAIYLAVEDTKTGIVAKLAGRIEPDPVTGQLTTSFVENPQLPIEDIELHLFGGPRAALITPPTCGTHTTTTTLTPWSSPEGADAHPKSSFQITQQPGGGSCPTSEVAAPHSPAFTAGTLAPQAGAFSPFVLKLSREDGSQRLTGIDTKLAPGLIGKLAGVGLCSESQIAQAIARNHPNEGILERQSPSCPASTQVGTVNVGAGAGPTPFYAEGIAYLAGPYKGAPVSLVAIVPAIAGPFDLGVVVTRVALHVEPETAQIHAVSDPLPTILEGIPLDLRSVALKMDRPDFTLNPTSCDPMVITGTATSALGQVAALSQPFHVGGCGALPFKPKVSLRLKGSVKRSSNPALIATLRAKGGEANVARAQVKLPHAVFLDQSHIRTVCTRVQFAADTCPAGSVYGRVSATTPLLDYPLGGAVYLRSSSHKLPDLVAKLKGPVSQPIEIVLDGKTDAVKGALRNTFEAVPDAPVSKFRLELFGGKRGLVEMSDGFCSHRRATVNLDGQNGKTYGTRPVVAAKCTKKHGRAGRSVAPMPTIRRSRPSR